MSYRSKLLDRCARLIFPNSGPRTATEWFNTSAFQPLAPDPTGQMEVFGNEGRNAVQGPGYVNWDFSAFKSIRMTESKELQFRGELFNVLNHTNFGDPQQTQTNGSFGSITSTNGDPRIGQLSLKLDF